MVSNVPKTRPAYPPEFRCQAVQMLRAGRTPRELAASLGVAEQMLRNWRRQDEVDRHERTDVATTAELEQLRALRREDARLSRSVTCSNEPRRRTSAADRRPAPLSPWR